PAPARAGPARPCAGGRRRRRTARPAAPSAVRGLLAAREGAVPGDRDVLRGLPAPLAGGPDADGPLDRGPVPVRRRPARGARGAPARLAALARATGEVRAAARGRAVPRRRDP